MTNSGYTGSVVAAALAGWGLLTHPGASGTLDLAGTVLAGVTAWTLGARWARTDRLIPGLVLAAGIIALFLANASEPLDNSDSPPTGYENANLALVVTAVAAVLGAAAVAPTWLRRCLFVLAAPTPILCDAVGSRAAAVSCLLLLVCWPLTAWGSSVVWQAISAIVLLAGLAVVFSLGLSLHSGQAPDFAVEVMSEERVSLWSDAIEQAHGHPVAGVGPGNYASHSALASSDPLFAWAHSAPLQILAELGFVGFGLLVLLTAWMIRRLGRSSIVLTVLALQPMIDHVLDFVVVLATGCFALGILTQIDGWRRPPQSRAIGRHPVR